MTTTTRPISLIPAHLIDQGLIDVDDLNCQYYSLGSTDFIHQSIEIHIEMELKLRLL